MVDDNAVNTGSQEPNVLVRREKFGQRHTQKVPGEDTNKEGRWPCEDRGRHWSDAEEARKGLLLEA